MDPIVLWSRHCGEKKNLLSLPGIKPPQMMGMKIAIPKIFEHTGFFSHKVAC
jgi:hypothetical protein